MPHRLPRHSSHRLVLICLAASLALPWPAAARADQTQRWARLRKAYLAELRARVEAVPATASLTELAAALGPLTWAESPEVRPLRRALEARIAARLPERLTYEDTPATSELLHDEVLARQHGAQDRSLGDRLFALNVAAVKSGASGASMSEAEWAEAAPRDDLVAALAEIAPSVQEGDWRAEFLTRLGNALVALGRKQEAVARFQEAVAQPGAEKWPEGNVTTMRAYEAWARVEPEVALAKARAQLGSYTDTWGGPEALVAPVVAAAAETVARTDLPLAIAMVREAPQTTWTLGGVFDTRGRAMLSLAQAIAAKHPAEAEQLIVEAMKLISGDVLPALAALPADRGRSLFYNHFPEYRVGKLTKLQVISPTERDHFWALARLDPALLPKLVARWGELLRQAGERRDDLTTESPALTGLVSKEAGDRFIARGPKEPGWAEARLVEWVDLLALMPGNGPAADARR